MQLWVLMENFIQVPGLPKKGAKNDWGNKHDRSKAWGFSYVRPCCITLKLFWDGRKSTWTLNKELLLALSCCRREQSVLSAQNLKQLWNPNQKASEWESFPFSWSAFLLKTHSIPTPMFSPVFPIAFITVCLKEHLIGLMKHRVGILYS